MTHLQPDFGGDDDIVTSATLLEPVPDDGLGFTAPISRRKPGIDVGGVDQIESGGDEGVEQPEGGLLIRGPAKDVAAEGQRRYFQSRISNSAFSHSLFGAVMAR